MKELLLYILNNIAESDAIKVEEEENQDLIVFKVTAPSTEIGKIIGKGGKIISSIKNILKIKAIKEGKKIDIQIVEA